MYRNRIRHYTPYVYAAIIGLVISLISTYLHHPTTPVLLGNWGFKYNDIVYGVFNPRFSPGLSTEKIREYWYNPEKYYSITRDTRELVYPYIDYMFEYPPLIGLLWIISVNTAIHVNLPEKYTPHYYREKYESIITTHYMINAVVNSISLILVLLLSVKASTILGINWKKTLLAIVMPSLYMYLTYNWDIICSLFLLLGTLYFIKKKLFVSGIFIGLSITTKLLPLLTIPPILALLLKNTRENRDYRNLYGFLMGLVIGLSGFIALALLSFNKFMDFIEYHGTWYCENCLYQLVEPNIFNPLHRILSIIFIGLSVLVITYFVKKSRLYNNRDILSVVLYSIIASTALNYVFTPQMMLLITPIALIVLNGKKLIMYGVSDLANAMIMIMFFQDGHIREFFYNIGVPVPLKNFNPWTIDSPVQWVSIIRNILLIIIMISIVNELRKKSPN